MVLNERKLKFIREDRMFVFTTEALVSYFNLKIRINYARSARSYSTSPLFLIRMNAFSCLSFFDVALQQVQFSVLYRAENACLYYRTRLVKPLLAASSCVLLITNFYGKLPLNLIDSYVIFHLPPLTNVWKKPWWI